MFDPLTIKSQFPIFNQKTPHGNDLVYLDNAATCHKPQVVIHRIKQFYEEEYGTVGRSTYWPAANTSLAFEEIRRQVADFINAEPEEVVFNFGTTDAINKIANSYLRPRVQAGDAIVISEMEHHSNLLPWQQICQEKGAELKVIPIDENGVLNVQALKGLLDERVKMVAITAVSNALGIRNDLEEICRIAHQFDIPVFVDAAQSLSHEPMDMKAIDCDLLAFSGHKIYGPTGVGVLYAKKGVLDNSTPLSFGGGIVKEVNFDSVEFTDGIKKHEAGTPNIAGIFGLGAAIQFVTELGMENVKSYTESLAEEARKKLADLDGVTVYGGIGHMAPVVSFTVDGIHPHDLSSFFNEQGVCIRAGHHCAQPLMKRLKVPATVRASFAIYNTSEDIDKLVNAVEGAKAFFL